MEADHGSADRLTRRSDREIQLVRDALEDRDLPQNTEIRLQGRTIEAAHGGRLVGTPVR